MTHVVRSQQELTVIISVRVHTGNRSPSDSRIVNPCFFMFIELNLGFRFDKLTILKPPSPQGEQLK